MEKSIKDATRLIEGKGYWLGGGGAGSSSKASKPQGGILLESDQWYPPKRSGRR